MLKKIHRLPLRKEGKQFYQEGQTLYSPLFKVIKKENKEGINRFAFIVSKKIDNSAVIRNRIKRKLRAVAQKLISNNPPLDVLIIANKNCLDTKPVEIEKTLRATLVK